MESENHQALKVGKSSEPNLHDCFPGGVGHGRLVTFNGGLGSGESPQNPQNIIQI